MSRKHDTSGYLKGALILAVSALLTKLVGACFKIPLTNLLGGAGMGYFSCAYGLFLPVYALSVTGLSTAVAKVTAERAAFAMWQDVRKLRTVALLVFSAAGLLGTLFLFLSAGWFCTYVYAEPQAWLSVCCIAPAILTGCISAVYRGSFEGLQNMMPTALSQLIEAAAKLVLGLGFCFYVLRHPSILEVLPAGITLEAAAAAAAILGVTVSSVLGTLWLMLRIRLQGDGVPSHDPRGGSGGRTLLKEMLRILIPAAAVSLVTNLTSLIDLATGVRCLTKAVESAPEAFSRLLPEAAQEGTAALSNFIYGSYAGMALTVFNLVPSVTNMFAKSLLPCASEAYAKGDKEAFAQCAAESVLSTAFLAVPAGLALTIFAEPALALLYPSRTEELAAAAPSLACLGIGVIFVALSFPLFTLLQAAGHGMLPVLLMLVGAAVKLVLNVCLIPIPAFQIAGAGISTTVCYGVLFFLALLCCKKAADLRLPLGNCLLKPLYAGCLCAAAASLVYDAAAPWGRLALLPAAVCGAGVYLLVLLLLGINPRKDKATGKASHPRSARAHADKPYPTS